MESKYKMTKELGRGTWGVVYGAVQKETGRDVAIKKIKSMNKDDGINFTAIREIKLLREFKHPNIIELVDVYTTPDQAVSLIYECAYTDLEKIIKDKRIPISMADTKQHMKTLLLAIAACHDRWILHRDLKPDNCLFLKDGTMKLADFGLARLYGTPKTRLSPQAITLWYKPPELLLGSWEYSAAADMWSVGCIFAELMLRRPIFPQPVESDIAQLETIFTVMGSPTETNWPDHTTLPLVHRGLLWDTVPGIPLEEVISAPSAGAMILLKSLLVLDPNKRWTAQEALASSYFSNNDPPPSSKEDLVLEAPN